jgi:hypothetical protein
MANTTQSAPNALNMIAEMGDTAVVPKASLSDPEFRLISQWQGGVEGLRNGLPRTWPPALID